MLRERGRLRAGSTPRAENPPADGHAIATRRSTAVGAASLTLVLVVLATSVFYSLPSNVLSVRDGGALRSFSARFMPQSWAFFTKPADDPELVPYRVGADGTLSYASALPNSRPDNLFGLSRRQRAQGPEIAAMANQVSRWTDCSDQETDCTLTVARAGSPTPVENSSPVATLCGTVLLVETEPVPWAFRDDYTGWRLDRRAALVEAACPR